MGIQSDDIEIVGTAFRREGQTPPQEHLRVVEATVVIGSEPLTQDLAECNLHIYDGTPGETFVGVYAIVNLASYPHRAALGTNPGDALSAYHRLRNCASAYGPYGDTTYFNGRKELVSVPLLVIN